MWGIKKQRVIDFHGMDNLLVLERGYVGDRFFWTSFGWGGLNGRADFHNSGMPGDRWGKHFAECMKPWRGHHDGDYVLIMGQVPNDAAVKKHVNFMAWVDMVVRGLKRRGEKPVFRPHPMSTHLTTSQCRTIGGTLEDAFARAKWVVTFNSNSAVDAVLAGVPAVSVDRGSMAWAVTGRDPLSAPDMPPRDQWAYNLAYTQWSPEELRSGEALEHVARWPLR